MTQSGEVKQSGDQTFYTNGLKVGDWIETGWGQARIAEFEVEDGRVFAVGALFGGTFKLDVNGLEAIKGGRAPVQTDGEG